MKAISKEKTASFKRTKGLTVIFLALALIFMCALTGCAGSKPEIKDPVTVVDQAGRTVTVPSKIDKIAIANMPMLAPALVQFLGGGKKIVGMPKNSIQDNSIARKVVGNLDDINTDFYAAGTINVESLALLEPDVVFASVYAPDIAVLEAAGFTVVAVNSQFSGINALETVASWYTLFGKVFQNTERTAQYVEYNNEMYFDIKSRLASVSEMPTVLYMPWFPSWWETSPNGYAGQYYSETTAAINAGADCATFVFNAEQVASWNPDIIYLASFNGSATVAEFYANSNTTQFWSDVKAVKNQRVYKLPGGFCNWFQPTAESALSLLYQSKIQHPDRFADIDVKQTVKEYYKNFYGAELTDDELTFMLG